MVKATMTQSELFKNSFVISMAHRVDRRTHIDSLFKKYNVPFEYFDAINGHEINYSGPLLKGEEGVRLSHVNLLEKSIKENNPFLFIFEDDVDFSENFTEELDRALSVLPDNFDMFYLGASHHQRPILYKENVYKINHSYTAHAVCIKSNMFEHLKNAILQHNYLQVDVIYGLVQNQINAYAVYPHLAWQINSYSDIQNKFIDYDFLKKEFVRFEN